MGCHCPWNLTPLLLCKLALTQPHTALYPSTTAFRAHQYSYAARSEFFFFKHSLINAESCSMFRQGHDPRHPFNQISLLLVPVEPSQQETLSMKIKNEKKKKRKKNAHFTSHIVYMLLSNYFTLRPPLAINRQVTSLEILKSLFSYI